jgi:hypothetical protein
MDENQVALIAEQLKHALDLMKADVDTLRAQQGHDREMANRRLEDLEGVSKDHETRLRTVQDGVTQFKVWAGLASGGSGIVSVIAFVKAFFTGTP